MSMSSPLRVDVLINGGGPVGALLAAVLGRAGVRVAVIEAAPPEVLARPGSDARAIAIAYTARKVIAAAGAWDGMKDEAGEILEIRVTDDASPLFLHYDHQEIGADPLGWIVPNPAIRRELLAALGRIPDVTLLAPARLKRLERLPHRVEAELEDGRVVHAALAVAADGRGSMLRQQAGIKVTRRDYHESGIVCIMAHERPHHGIAHERFRCRPGLSPSCPWPATAAASCGPRPTTSPPPSVIRATTPSGPNWPPRSAISSAKSGWRVSASTIPSPCNSRTP